VPEFERFIDLPTAAELLQLHPDTLKKKTRTGEIPGMKIGRRWRFRASALDAWVRSKLVSESTQVTPR
jgi:excisionase family DNA binding protein